MAIRLPPELERYERYLRVRAGEPGTWQKVVVTLDERLDYLNIQLAELIRLQQRAIPGTAQFVAANVPHYNIRTFALDSARNEAEIQISGDHIAAWTDGTLIGSTIKPDQPSADPIYLDKFNPFSYPTGFSRFYLTTTVQTGKTLYLFIGRAAGATTLPEITTSAEREVIYTLKTDKDLHFTSALGQYAKEDENITGLITNKIRINSVVIQSDQRLKYKLMFWHTDTFDDTNLDLSSYHGDIDLDLSVYGYQVDGTGQWYMGLTNLQFDYLDEDNTNELHISLINMSGTGKVAGATGEVVIHITYSPRT